MSKQNRDKGEFIKIEYNLLDLVEYNGVEVDAAMKVILSLAISYDRETKTYYESVPTIGKRIGRSDNPTRALLKKMEEAGMIRRETQTGSTSKISPTLDASLMVFIDDEAVKTPAQTSAEVVSPDVVPNKPVTETESDTPENNPANIEFFDSNGVVTEAFIKLTDANRYGDGTLKNFRYVYWLARQAQDERDGVPVRTKEQYMGEAQSWHVPPHLLPKGTSEPVHDEEPNEDANFLT
ncbi:hypothetical protein [Pantoea sp. CTOTU50773]|uniref:hypothetical protein n=1 Tax=Pantoea sp. CTOTU50773 TaxID=2953853 RepID=UPI0028AB157F|nr:hypothetical protein [Pantoea sp. CTOTU50773]